jgi:inorganic triphosphatase YgiF
METELKLRCTDETKWNGILAVRWLADMAVLGSRKTEVMEAVYYDTPALALRKAKLAFRVRKEGAAWVATVKGGGSSVGGLHRRQEWNVRIGGCKANIEVFAGSSIGTKLRELVGREELQAVLITRFERQSLLVRTQAGDEIEVAADKGMIIAGEKKESILEVELELKAGRVEALDELGARLRREFPLEPEPASKYYRGLLLAGRAEE